MATKPRFLRKLVLISVVLKLNQRIQEAATSMLTFKKWN